MYNILVYQTLFWGKNEKGVNLKFFVLKFEELS